MVLAFNQLQIYESQKYVFYLNDYVFEYLIFLILISL